MGAVARTFIIYKTKRLFLYRISEDKTIWCMDECKRTVRVTLDGVVYKTFFQLGSRLNGVEVDWSHAETQEELKRIVMSEDVKPVGVRVIEARLYYGYSPSNTPFCELSFATHKDMAAYMRRYKNLRMAFCGLGAEIKFHEHDTPCLYRALLEKGIRNSSSVQILSADYYARREAYRKTIKWGTRIRIPVPNFVAGGFVFAIDDYTVVPQDDFFAVYISQTGEAVGVVRDRICYVKKNRHDRLGELLNCDTRSSAPLILQNPAPDIDVFEFVGRELPPFPEEFDTTYCREVKIHVDQLEKSPVEVPFDPVILSFDCEMYSPKVRAFPNKLDPDCSTRILGISVMRLSNPAERKKICIHIDPSDPVEGVELIKVETEVALYQTFTSVVLREDPDIITGYNILGFDLDYIDTRLQLDALLLRNIGRNPETKHLMFGSKPGPRGSSFTWPNIEGRLLYDILVYWQTLLPDRLPTYKLDYVCHLEIGEGKVPMPYHELNQIFTDSICGYGRGEDMARAIDYCVTDADLVLSLIVKKKVVTSCIAFSNIIGINSDDVIVRGQIAKSDALLLRGAIDHPDGLIIMDRRENIETKFEGGYVALRKPGMFQHFVVGDVQSMYPSTIRAENFSPDTMVVVTNPQSQTDTPIKIEFDIVKRTTMGQRYVEMAEESLEANASDSESDAGDDEDNAADRAVDRDFSEVTETFTKTEATYTFVKTSVRVGLVPSVVGELITERKAARAGMKGLKEDDPAYSILEAKQNALKITANSIYGALGNQYPNCRSCPEIAACVTARGRQCIKNVDAHMETVNGCTIIYNDTDSVFFSSPRIVEDVLKGAKVATPAHYKEMTQRHFELISEMNPGGRYEGVMPTGLIMECEKYCPFGIFLAPKMYVIWAYVKGEIKRTPKGVPLARRDCCKALLEPYSAIVDCIYEHRSIDKAIEVMVAFLLRIESLDQTYFETTTRYSGNFKSDNAQMFILGKALERIGTPPQVGEYLKYVIYTKDDWENGSAPKPKVSQRIATAEMLRAIPGARIDVKEYYRRRICKRLNGLLATCFSEDPRCNNILAAVSILNDRGFVMMASHLELSFGILPGVLRAPYYLVSDDICFDMDRGVAVSIKDVESDRNVVDAGPGGFGRINEYVMALLSQMQDA